MSFESLVNMLDGVCATGSGKCIARCPAHDDRSPSLAIKECEDGRILVHCFAGCETEDVLAAVGLSFSDIMPERVGSQQFHRPEKWTNAREALATLDHESLVVAVIGADFLQHHEINEDVWSRLASAVERINTTRTRFAPLRHRR